MGGYSLSPRASRECISPPQEGFLPWDLMARLLDQPHSLFAEIGGEPLQPMEPRTTRVQRLRAVPRAPWHPIGSILVSFASKFADDLE